MHLSKKRFTEGFRIMPVICECGVFHDESLIKENLSNAVNLLVHKTYTIPENIIYL